MLVRLAEEKAERERKAPGTALALSRKDLDEAHAKEFPDIQTLNVNANPGMFDAGAWDSRSVTLKRRLDG